MSVVLFHTAHVVKPCLDLADFGFQFHLLQFVRMGHFHEAFFGDLAADTVPVVSPD